MKERIFILAKKKEHFEEYEKLDLEEDLTLSEEVSAIEKRKKKKRRKKIITHIIMIISILLISISAFSVVSYCWSDGGMQKNAIANFEQYDTLFYVKEEFDKERIKPLREFINSMPQTAHDAMNDDWAIIIAPDVPISLFNSSIMSIKNYDTSEMKVGGFTFTQPRVIYLNSELNDEDFYRSFVHEVGHFISFEYASQHGSSEWEKIYRSIDKEKIDMDAYEMSNEAEFFAGCYEKYHTNPDLLKQSVPDAYTFMDELLKKEIGDDNIFETFFSGVKNSINTLRVYWYHYIVKG